MVWGELFSGERAHRRLSFRAMQHPLDIVHLHREKIISTKDYNIWSGLLISMFTSCRPWKGAMGYGCQYSSEFEEGNGMVTALLPTLSYNCQIP